MEATQVPTTMRRREASPAAWYALAVLSLLTLFSLVDRGVLSLLAETIRLKLGLSDLQLGFMQGTGVAVFSGLAVYPLAWLADRYDRRLILAGCVVFWCAAVVGCGLAQSYEQLAFAAAMVGAGEAGLAPIAFSAIPDLFGEKKRQLANSTFTVAYTASVSLSAVLCGQIIAWVELARPALPAGLQAMDGWRLSFIAAALPMPLMLLLIATIALPVAASKAAATPIAALLPYFRQQRGTLLHFFAGMGCVAFGFGAVNSWITVIYLRVYAQTPTKLGTVLGTISLVATAIGFLVSTYGLRYFIPRVGPRLSVRVLWLAALIAVALFAMMTMATRVEHMYAIHSLNIILMMTANMVYPTTLQSLAPGYLRARVVSIMMIIAYASAAIAPSVVGFVSDRLKHLPSGLVLAGVSVGIPFLLLGATLLFRLERSYENTVDTARALDAAAAPI